MGLNIAYSLSTLYYQTVSFSDHPRYSLVCIPAVVLFNVVLFGLLRRARSRVDVSLLATRKRRPPAVPARLAIATKEGLWRR